MAHARKNLKLTVIHAHLCGQIDCSSLPNHMQNHNFSPFKKYGLCGISMQVNSACSEYRQKLSSKKEDINSDLLQQMDIRSVPSKMSRTHFLRIAEAYGFSPSDFSSKLNLHPWNLVGGSKSAVTAPGIYVR